ncbi:MAG TPA: glycine cleavage system aminomethyltransferase GcvT [Clostridia bacterium]|nr:glycine cleavage system aminomethyltransferase GcvT [Clostridia bacterium]
MVKRTPLYETHIKYGGKMVEFAGYELPINYAKGIIFEHNTVRNGVGLFDVSHMGEILIKGENASLSLQKLVTNRIDTIKEKQCRYNLMLYENGTIVDDLLIYKINDMTFLLIVNASNKDKDFNWIAKNIGQEVSVEDISDETALLALQGPKADKVLARLADMSLIPTKGYYFNSDITVGGIKSMVSTTGYTGEAGYEIYCKANDAQKLYEKIMEEGKAFDIEPVGLGARDTLRFECSMPLYGHELSDQTKASEVGLDMFIKTDLDFIGKDALVNEMPKYKRIGLKLIDKGIARENCQIFDEQNNLIGYTTSGGMCLTVGGAYAMARVKKDFQGLAYIEVRGRRLLAEITPLPFYKRNKI